MVVLYTYRALRYSINRYFSGRYCRATVLEEHPRILGRPGQPRPLRGGNRHWDSSLKTSARVNGGWVGEAGFEPARGITSGDFKSPASAVPPLARTLPARETHNFRGRVRIITIARPVPPSPNVHPLQLGSIASFGQRYNWTRGQRVHVMFLGRFFMRLAFATRVGPIAGLARLSVELMSLRNLPCSRSSQTV